MQINDEFKAYDTPKGGIQRHWRITAIHADGAGSAANVDEGKSNRLGGRVPTMYFGPPTLPYLEKAGVVEWLVKDGADATAKAVAPMEDLDDGWIPA